MDDKEVEEDEEGDGQEGQRECHQTDEWKEAAMVEDDSVVKVDL